MSSYTLECCVDSADSALEAENGGASRLELCSSLITGGITPDLCLFRQIRRHCKNKIHVLLRPRFGDFLYTDMETALLKDNIQLFREEGADGIVIGCLTREGDLDLKLMEEFVRLAGTMPVTLHRAFDMCRDPHAALLDAVNLGVKTILTSGQKNSCFEGQELLKELAVKAGDRIEIMAGGGVSPRIIENMVRETGIRHFHMSGKKISESGMKYRKQEVSMGLPGLNEYEIYVTAKEEIKAAREILEKCFPKTV